MDATPPRPSDSSEDHVRKGVEDAWRALTETWTRLRAHFPAIRSHLREFGSVQAERVRISVRDLALRIALGVLIAAACVTAAVTATLHAARGVSAAVSELASGRTWVGDLAAGITMLALVVGGLQFWAKRLRKRNLARMLARFQRTEPIAPRRHVDFEPQGPEL